MMALLLNRMTMTMMHREPLLKLVLRFDGDDVTARFMIRVAVSVKLGLELSVDDNVSLFPYCYEIQGQTNVYIYI
jgi:hypothetical protein